MAKREKSEILPTLKAEPNKEDQNAVALSKDLQVTIKSVSDINTKFGEKTVASVEDNNGKTYNVFVNSTSQNTLIDNFGEDDEKWVGKPVNLKLETDEIYGKKKIAFHPVK